MLRELLEVTGEWRFLAISLELPVHEIRAIECDHRGDVRTCVVRMVEKWFELQPPSQLSWSRLCSALRDPLVARPDIAATIQRKYMGSDPC